MIHVQVSIGDRIKATATGEDSKRVLEEVAFFSELPAACPICGSACNFYFRNPKDFTYYGLKCTGEKASNNTAHECTFGQKRDGSGLFYKGKDSWDKAYVGDGSGSGGGEAAPETAPDAGVTEDDIPF